MAKEKVKLSIDQESDRTAVMTVEEAKELADLLKTASSQADEITDEKKEGRVEMEYDDGRLIVTVTKVKVEKKEDDEEEGESDR